MLATTYAETAKKQRPTRPQRNSDLQGCQETATYKAAKKHDSKHPGDPKAAQQREHNHSGNTKHEKIKILSCVPAVGTNIKFAVNLTYINKKCAKILSSKFLFLF